MWDVVRFSEYHHYKVVLVENVVQARKWRLFPAWLSAMEALDYKWHICYENSMFHGTPQSRDRMYVTFWKKDLPDPDLDFKVQAECEMCGTTLGIQSWKKPDYRWGKYKRQYVYVCEKCGKEVMPYYTPAYTAIDWSVIGTRIGDRDRPLAPKTMDRIRRGLEKYKNHCLVIKTTHSGNDGHYKSVGDPLPTQASRQSMALIVSTNYWRKNASHVFDALPTQTTGAQHALVVHMRRAGAVTTTADPLGTITAGGRHHALLQAPFLAVHYTPGHCKSIADSFATITASGDHHSLIIPKPFVDAYYGSDSSTPIDRALGTVTPIARHALVVPESVRVEDCYFRMLDIPEIAAGMGFRPGYILLGTKREKTKQCGQAVTPGVADDLYGRATAIL